MYMVTPSVLGARAFVGACPGTYLAAIHWRRHQNFTTESHRGLGSQPQDEVRSVCPELARAFGCNSRKATLEIAQSCDYGRIGLDLADHKARNGPGAGCQ